MVDFGGFYESITVRNGSVRGWLNGVDVERGRNALVENVHSSHNSEAGIVGGQGAVIRNCTARENAQQGIRVLKGASVVECTAESNAVDFPSGAGFVFGEGATLQDCAANRNISGFVGSMCSLSNCTAYQNIDYGFSIFVGTMSGCMATSNKVGIRVSNFTVSNCQAISNGEVGIWGEESILVGNRVRSNGSSSLVGYAGGIFATHLSRVEGNHCHANRRGIYCSGGAGNLIIRNTCISNTTNWSVGIGNALAPVVVASQTPGLFEGDSYAGSLGSTDPNANFTIIII
jgi:parallel beta-helix repeat protein